MTPVNDSGDVRLAELVAALSLGIDLGFNQPMEHVLRQCLIALRLADHLGVDEETRGSVYYTALLLNVGCHSDAHEQAKWFGDDIDLKAGKYAEQRGVRGALADLRRIGSGTDGGLARLRSTVAFAVSGYREIGDMIVNHASIAGRLASSLGLPESTVAAVGASYEQWDGKGWPGDLHGDAVPLATRLASIGEFVEVAHRLRGVDGACALVRRERGKQFDQRLADQFLATAEMLLTELDGRDSWAAVIDAEPALDIRLDPATFDAALLAIADFIDLKSPFTLGHARAVADLVAGAAPRYGLGEEEARTTYRAALVHGLGKLGVSNAILDKAPPLGAGERERIRLIPYVTQRMLRQSPALAPLGAIAVQYGERLDGSGFPSGLSGTAIGREARLLGAADAYQVLREPRPHRDPWPADEAARRLRAEARAGRLDADAVEAVLGAAGHRVTKRVAGPAGLTAREIDVLRLIARGLTAKEVAARLVISRKTVANHIEHIYAKIGATNRASAALFATQHGLLGAEETVLT